MGKKKAATKLAVSTAAAKGAAEAAKGRALELQERITPAVEDARERLAPAVEDARERLAPRVAEARELLAPVVDEARERLADLAETVATRIDDALPDDQTPALVKKASANNKSGGKLKKLLLLTGLGGLAFFVARRSRGEKPEPRWQSTAPATPAPTPSSSTAPAPAAEQAAASASAPAAAVAGMVSAEPNPDSDDTGGGTPDEAAADAANSTGIPTTPDDPAATVQIEKP
jgi:vacuolar-type H+-ATPase subunit H